MCQRLKDKVAIVVGAGSAPGEGMGNGRATAILFAREGARVMLVDYRLDSAQETKKIIDKEGGESFAFRADVTKSEDCRHMADTCVQTYGRIDILHNNVGIGEGGGPVELSEEDWDRVLNTNLKGMFLTCKHVLPYMAKQGSGAIINISSLAAIRCQVYPYVSYTASKAGVNGFTRDVAMQYAHQGIRVNCIMPGFINTPMAIETIIDRTGMDRADLIRMRDSAVPMNHMGDAWDVAYAALFLASDEAKFITGIAIPVDGGQGLKS
ncbi:MAG: SDR family oxidoreductase [Candidatus Abyssobacteria bacterium SURF_17]|jgi:NAD(P)-dependent dehydrogenase (short-subunit alcohol dehydrogenase family)|uniref:SDR family oxidoreductase n=1 Tax=Candidatus Abyssobacteria bacterium SURF_17 TaxID=2093361 RepID=A0A419F010_9BACT|nr:MAG: SDR family oxidoreductase [Candidatus Abyssubacteria bacterium SURF_17]